MTRKIGLYLQVTAAAGVREMLTKIKPAVVLVHLDGGDLFGWLKANLPETFVVGRPYWSNDQQESLLYTTGTAIAGQVLALPGAQHCDAFMMFNEFLPSPVDNGGRPDYQAKARRLDALQVEYLQALRAAGKEAVANNFSAGNWPTLDHYREHLPLTMAAYKHLGWHCYGWPRLTAVGWHSNLDETLRIVDALPDKVHILTEVAVTRAYANPGPDEGWLSHGDGAPLSLDAYAGDLRAVADALNGRAHILGACLFNASPDPRWLSFAVTAELVERMAEFPEIAPQEGAENAKGVRLGMPLRMSDALSHISQWFGENPQNYDGMGHEGIDFAVPAGTPIYAACAGKVHPTVQSVIYGNYVRLQSAGTLENPVTDQQVQGTWETVYAHMSKRLVQPGEWVEAGQQIGEVGTTGRSTGNHLHFGLRLPGQKSTDKFYGYSDPAPWLGLARPGKPVTWQDAYDLLDKRLKALEKA